MADVNGGLLSGVSGTVLGNNTTAGQDARVPGENVPGVAAGMDGATSSSPDARVPGYHTSPDLYPKIIPLVEED